MCILHICRTEQVEQCITEFQAIGRKAERWIGILKNLDVQQDAETEKQIAALGLRQERGLVKHLLLLVDAAWKSGKSHSHEVGDVCSVARPLIAQGVLAVSASDRRLCLCASDRYLCLVRASDHCRCLSASLPL
jgi:hypothetical protein